MKFKFTTPELELLHSVLKILTEVSNKGVREHGADKNAADTMRTFARMRYKFTPNSNDVYLVKRERDLILNVMLGLIERAAMTADKSIPRSIIRKVTQNES